MRIVIARMSHETNTFSPVPTPIGRFARGQAMPYLDQEVIPACKGTGTGMGAFIELGEKLRADLVTPIAAAAPPSGPVEDKAFEFMADKICEAVAKGCDAILLELHGAMVTQSLDDGEGELLRRVRALAPRTPIGVSLDMHTNLYPAMVENCDVIAGYQTYPHIDLWETGMRAAKPILGMLEGRVRPVMVWGNRPMLPHVMRQGSDDEPNKWLQQRCRSMEAEGALAASLFVGFPHADIREAGLSSVVVTNGNLEQANAWRDELLDHAWKNREAFVYKIEPLADSLARAEKLAGNGAGKPVVLLDHYDNSASGGTMDTMTVLGAMLDRGLENVAAFAVHDPRAVQAMIQAGVGNTVTLKLGGKYDMPSIKRRGEPKDVTGRVKLISNGQYRNRGPMGRGVLMDMGPSVVLDTGKAEIIVISRHQEPNDIECFQSMGIDPTRKKFLMLKSRVHWRAAFRPVISGEVECAGVGVCTSDYSMLDFQKVRRSVYPLDRINTP